MKKTLIPHLQNQYRDSAGWTVIVVGVDYENRIAVIQTLSVGNQMGDPGAFSKIFEQNPEAPQQVPFSKLREGGVVQLMTGQV